MKGVLFTEFLELLEHDFGLNTLDRVLAIAEPNLSTGGAYTSVGAYPHTELLALVEATVSVTNADLGDMLNAYADRLMHSFEQSYPHFFSAYDDFAEFMLNVEGQMHAGVRKLYTDAAPPTLEVSRVDASTLKLIYRSHRPLSIVVKPLVVAAAKRYATSIEIEDVDPVSEGTHSEHILRIS